MQLKKLSTLIGSARDQAVGGGEKHKPTPWDSYASLTALVVSV
jgi:hypothetical protein